MGLDGMAERLSSGLPAGASSIESMVICSAV